MTPLRPLLLGAVLLAACSPVSGAGAGAQDARAALDDYNVRAAIILQCHPSQNDADRAYLAKGDALHQAALKELQAELDRADPANRAGNAKKADDTLKQQRSARDFDISEQARNYGCDWLDGRLAVLPRNN